MIIRYGSSLLAILLLVTAGCAGRSPEASFYRLEGNAVQTPVENPVWAAERLLVIQPVRLPTYLKRPQLVVRSDSGTRGELEISETHRWAGELEEELERVLLTDLGRRLGEGRVFAWRQGRGLPATDKLNLTVTDLIGTPGGNLTLDARWTLLDVDSREVYAARHSVIVEPVGGADYADLVAAHGRALGALSAEIAEAIRMRSVAAGATEPEAR